MSKKYCLMQIPVFKIPINLKLKPEAIQLGCLTAPNIRDLHTDKT